jgi:hypothetical protein
MGQGRMFYVGDVYVGRIVMNQEDIVKRATSKGVRFIIEVITGAHAIYRNPENYGAAAIRDHTASVTAACINCHIIQLAARLSVSEDMKGLVRIKQTHGRTTFILADYTEVWYKKLNKSGKPSFRVSQQALEYTEPPYPMLDMELPPKKMRLVAGYRPYGAGIEYEILVTGPQEDGKWWEVHLAGDELPELFPSPAPALVPDTTTDVIKKRVQIRKQKKSKGDASDEQSV